MFDSHNIDFHPITILNWEAYPSAPNSLRFRIAHSKEELYLQFEVEEEVVRATYTDDETSKPYEDSCVEFFWMPADDDIYYNLEFNAIGTLLFEGGPTKANRYRFPNEVTAQIRRASTLGRDPFDLKEGPCFWRLTAAIPLSLFTLSPIPPLDGRCIKANFYKCGDNLPVPHFVSWNPITTEHPNFHTPQFFGTIHFNT